jgi:hypothetical protein
MLQSQLLFHDRDRAALLGFCFGHLIVLAIQIREVGSGLRYLERIHSRDLFEQSAAAAKYRLGARGFVQIH